MPAYSLQGLRYCLTKQTVRFFSHFMVLGKTQVQLKILLFKAVFKVIFITFPLLGLTSINHREKWQETVKRLTAQHPEAPIGLCGKCQIGGWPRTKIIRSKIHMSLRARLTFQEAEGSVKHRNDKAKGQGHWTKYFHMNTQYRNFQHLPSKNFTVK